MALFQVGIDVSRYQGSINWSAVAAAGKQFAIVRIGSSNNNGAYVDPYFLQNVNGAHAAGLRVGAYYYTYARTESAVAGELTTFLNALEGLQLEYPVFVDVEARSLTSLGKPQLTNLVKYAMDILNQRKWYAGWYSYTNYINSYMNASALANYPSIIIIRRFHALIVMCVSLHRLLPIPQQIVGRKLQNWHSLIVWTVKNIFLRKPYTVVVRWMRIPRTT